MKLSVIIPAYNEAKCIRGCLGSVFEALAAHPRGDLATEVIVVDNNSTDGTGDLARTAGARVVFEPVNQIARARNAGAAAATGAWFLFLDADSLLPPATLGEILDRIESGEYAGGGTVIAFDNAPFWAKIALAAGNFIFRLSKITPGCMIFCRVDAFRAIGGFNEELFAAEDAVFGRELWRWGKRRGLRTIILHKHPPVTSSRKLYLYTKAEMLALLLRFFLAPKATLRDRRGLQIFYDGRR
ncbi:MAG: glycosyltransferase [Verrucomicrobia bacterium]|nr:glycosyltransferase [Verrucomicrobiota bacterium]